MDVKRLTARAAQLVADAQSLARPGSASFRNARGTDQPRERSAACRVCSIKVLIVIGPTPPGTGV